MKSLENLAYLFLLFVIFALSLIEAAVLGARPFPSISFGSFVFHVDLLRRANVPLMCPFIPCEVIT
jgi:hypothetical protein